MRKRAIAMVPLLAGTLLFAACGLDEGGVDPPIGEVSSGLNGTWTLVGCSSAETIKLQQAFEHIDERLGSDEYLECMKAAFIAYERHDVMVEDIIALLRSRPTQITCVAGACGGGAAACSGVPPWGELGPEEMAVEAEYIAAASPAALAAAIVHEATHSLGFNHPGSASSLGYPWSVPSQAQACMSNLLPRGMSREQTYGDTELSPIGGGGGQPFLIRCPAGSRVIGITANTSSLVNRLGLRCSNGSVTPTAGSFSDSTATQVHTCAAGSSLVSSFSWSDSIVRFLISQCAPDSELVANDPTPTRQSHFLGGSFTGTGADRRCPTGMAIVGATGRAGARIDQLRWICQDIDGALAANPITSSYRGTKEGNGKLEQCSGNGVVRGLYGHAGAEVDQLGAECYATRIVGGQPTMETSTGRHGLDYNGGTGGPPFEKPCPSGTALVGLRFWSGDRIDAIGGVCADPASWASGGTTTVNTPLSGGLNGTYSVVTCPSRSFISGLRTWAAFTPQHGTVTVHAVEPLCRRLI